MRTLEQPGSLRGAADVRRWLAERLEETGVAHGATVKGDSGVLATGWAEVDVALGSGGLRIGATHEWHGMGGVRGRDGEWQAPLGLMTHVAWRAAERLGEGSGWVVWVGRRVWAYPPALAKLGDGGLLARSVWVDAPGARERLWAVDAALRTGGLVVVADGSGLTLGGSRRLQLGAEVGGAVGLLARPGWERRERSAAATRWEVSSRVGSGGVGGWSVCLSACKGARASSLSARTWWMERSRDGGVVVVSDGVADGSVASALAS